MLRGTERAVHLMPIVGMATAAGLRPASVAAFREWQQRHEQRCTCNAPYHQTADPEGACLNAPCAPRWDCRGARGSLTISVSAVRWTPDRSSRAPDRKWLRHDSRCSMKADAVSQIHALVEQRCVYDSLRTGRARSHRACALIGLLTVGGQRRALRPSAFVRPAPAIACHNELTGG